MCTQKMRYVEVCELLARAQETLHYETAGNFFVTNATNIVEIFFSEARQRPGVTCEPLKFSDKLPASSLKGCCLLECIHCRRERILNLSRASMANRPYTVDGV